MGALVRPSTGSNGIPNVVPKRDFCTQTRYQRGWRNWLPLDGADDYDQRMADDAEPTGVIEPAEPIEAFTPTELAGVANADTMSAFAWSEDDGVDEPVRQWPFWATTAAVATSLALVTVAGVLGFRYATDEAPAPVAVIAPVTTTVAPTPKAAPPPLPPPPPVTVTTVVVQSTVQVPQAAPASPSMTAADWSYIARMQAYGWIVQDPQLMAQRGREVCAMLHSGQPYSQVQQQLMGLQGVADGKGAWQIMDASMQSYPNCP